MLFEYALLVAALFLPGVFISMVLRLDRGRTLVEWITLAMVLGLAATVVAGVVIFLLVGHFFSFQPLLYATAGLAGSIGLLGWRRLPTSVNRFDLLAILVFGLHLGVLALFFVKYPIFPPEINTNDYAFYLVRTSGILGGDFRGFADNPARPLFLEFLLATGVTALAAQLPLVSIRHTMVIAAGVMPLLVYVIARRLWDGETAVVSAAIYSFAFEFWSLGVLTTGFYANFFSALVFVGLVLSVIDYTEKPEKGRGIAISLLGVVMLLSHSSAVIHLFILLAFGVGQLLFRLESAGNYFRALGWLSFPAGLVIIHPSIVISVLDSLLGVISSGAGGAHISYPSSLSDLLSLSPFLSVFSGQVGAVLFFFVILSLGAALYDISLRRVSKWKIFSVMWFLTLWVIGEVRPGSTTEIRLILLAYLPLSLLVGFGYSKIRLALESLTPRPVSKYGLLRYSRRAIGILLVAFLGITGTFGGTANLVALNTNFLVLKQTQVLESMYWVRDNSTPNEKVISVGLPWYRFLPEIAGREHVMEILEEPGPVSKLAAEEGVRYIALFDLVGNKDISYASLYRKFEGLSLRWSNDIVAIFELRK